MFDIINPVAVGVASLAGFAWGAIWYSPTLFIKPWMEAQGKKAPEKNSSAQPKLSVMIYGLATIVTYVFALSVFFATTEATELMFALQVGLLICFGFIITVKFSDMLYTLDGSHWQKNAQVKFFVDAGYYIGLTIVATVVLTYLHVVRI